MKFYVADCPENLTVFRWLERETNLTLIMRTMSARWKGPRFSRFSAEGLFDSVKLREQVLAMSRNHGLHRWSGKNTQSAENSTSQAFYYSQSLVYNPRHIDNEQGVYNSTLGTPRNSLGEFFWNQTQNHVRLKDSYFDTYSFNRKTPAASEGELGRLLGDFSRTLIRSRLSVIKPENFTDVHRAMGPDDPGSNLAGWHKDEPLFSNLRINLPVISDKNYGIQVDTREIFALESGYLYSWDTSRAHRAYAAATAKEMRFTLVIGLAPWFDYIESEDAWVTNEFFARMHPVEMLMEGHIHAGLSRNNRLDNSLNLDGYQI